MLHLQAERYTLKSFTVSRTEAEKKAIQDLKNHQEFVTTTNQWLNKLQSAIDEIRKDVTSLISSADSRLKYQEISIQDLHSLFATKTKKDNEQIQLHEKIISESYRLIFDSIKEQDKKIELINSYCNLISELKQRSDTQDIELKSQKQLIKTESIRLQQMIESFSQNTIKTISNLPSEVPEINRIIKETVESFNVNRAGYVQEIETLKRSVFVCSKYIEDLSMKIDKLKGEKA